MKSSVSASTQRLTVGQAVVKFLMVQYVERDGVTEKFFGGTFGIFGHGNVAGLGQAILQYEQDFPYYQGRSEQGMVHAAIGYAKMRNRLGALAVTTSVGPGATNMLTGAATATANHIPVLLFPSDTFATRRSGAVLQQIEQPYAQDTTANDAFRSVSRYFDRVARPEALASALLEAMRVLTSPSDTGAVTIALPQDVQAEAFDFPSALFERREWHVARNRPDRVAIRRAADMIRSASNPVIIAGGGVIYSEASAALIDFAGSTGIGVGVTQAGKAGMPHAHELALGALGSSGSLQANSVANASDLVIGIGTRYTDFTTASNTLFQTDGVQFININVAEIDALKESAVALVGDARETILELAAELDGWSLSDEVRLRNIETAGNWRREVDQLVAITDETSLSQAEMIGLVNAAADPDDVVVNAAGSMPGDLHRLWRAGSVKGYDIEYGNSCMGYEIAGAVGAQLADPSRHVFSLVGDGSYLMLSAEIMTAVQENLRMTFIIVDNSGYGSIAALSETLGSQALGTHFRKRSPDGLHNGDRIDVDFAANAASYGAVVFTASTPQEFATALKQAKASTELAPSVIYVRVDSQARFGGSGAWWDVPVAEVSSLQSTQDARSQYEANRGMQALYL